MRLPYITPPIVLFQLFGEKSYVCTLKVNTFMCSRSEGARRRSHIKETALISFSEYRRL